MSGDIGPIKFILKLKSETRISKIVTNKKKTLAVRFPKNKLTQKLLRFLNYPVAAPSANISTNISPVSAEDVKEEFGKKIKFILNDGSSKVGLESTIISLVKKPEILRHGGIEIKKISKILKKKIKFKSSKNKILAPGNAKVHYSPHIPMRLNIKKALYNEQLGDPNKTPATATEITERMADLSRQIGSAFGRLQAEFVNPILRRVIYLLKKQGRIQLPTIGNREIKIKPVSPLAQAQNNQDVSIIDRFLDIIGARFGPESLNMFVKTDIVAGYIARKLGLPGNIIRSPEEQQQIIAQMQQMAQQQQPQE